MQPIIFAATETNQGIGVLGVNLQAFIIQVITFVLVILVLKRYAFKPIVNMLDKRRQTIEDGVKLGLEMEEQKILMKEKSDEIIRQSHAEADKIVGNAHKEARDISRDARNAAHNRSNQILQEAQTRIAEETQQSRLKLEKDIAGLVSEATEVIVHEKVDSKKDNELIKKTVKGQL
jgi:F-type H+-transporting ATPase subunit b